jgi:hypothetical protein
MSKDQRKGDEFHTLSLRFKSPQWKALQTECHERRMNGERISVAELVRKIIDQWMAGPKRPRE